MKPYGKKKAKRTHKVEGHNSDECGICSNRGWKKSKKRARKEWKKEELEDK